MTEKVFGPFKSLPSRFSSSVCKRPAASPNHYRNVSIQLYYFSFQYWIISYVSATGLRFMIAITTDKVLILGTNYSMLVVMAVAKNE